MHTLLKYQQKLYGLFFDSPVTSETVQEHRLKAMVSVERALVSIHVNVNVEVPAIAFLLMLSSEMLASAV